jgi:3-methylcrotonyl-CoA carboxylase alpha subunit
MRRVDEPADFLAALESCKREAKSSFGNDEVLLEKWITSPRHIEVQVFGDSHGNVVHLFERDCSLQRRHQKVIEEAPAPGMDATTREAICAAAVRAAKAVGYVGAGTIEFIADASEGLRATHVFFMEMNTRLQVEHPVTEEITGVDLVEWQLRVASGEPLPSRQEELSINGHAIEARLYAEDPAKGFLPSTGRLEILDLNQDQHGTWPGMRFRIETGVAEGDTISPFYDPMIAKIVVRSETREGAIWDLVGLTDLTQVWPVKSNASFLYNTLRNEDFQAGRITTAFIEANIDNLVPRAEPTDLQWDMAARLILDDSDVTSISGFRLNSKPVNSVTLSHEGVRRTLEWSALNRNATAFGDLRDDVVVVFDEGRYFEFSRYERGSSHPSAHDGDILAPMPGKVIAVDVTEGQAVEAGQRLLVLEAMKMEHALTAPFAGTVAELTAHEGQQVQVEALLARVEKDAD